MMPGTPEPMHAGHITHVKNESTANSSDPVPQYSAQRTRSLEILSERGRLVWVTAKQHAEAVRELVCVRLSSVDRPLKSKHNPEKRNFPSPGARFSADTCVGRFLYG